jgi:hypothetical protein
MLGSGADRLSAACHLSHCQWLPIGSDLLGIARRSVPPDALSLCADH